MFLILYWSNLEDRKKLFPSFLVTMVASSLHAKVVLGGVTKQFFLLCFGHFGFFLKSHFKVRNRRSHVPKAFQEIANVFISQFLSMIIKNELTPN
jgi:hypothetical protein